MQATENAKKLVRGSTIRRCVTTAFLTICAAGAAASDETSAPDAEERARKARLSVSVSPARRQCFKEAAEVSGFLVGRHEVEVDADKPGLKVAQILVDPLDQVTTGQALARLAPMGDRNAGASVLLKSPVAGTVKRSGAILNAPAVSQSGGLFTIIANGELDMQADVKPATLARLAPNQSVRVTPLGQDEVTGKVRIIAPNITPASQYGSIRISIDTPGRLRAGTFARGLIELGERCGVGIPYSAVMYEREGPVIHVVKDGRVEARKVTVGLLSGADIEIRSGIDASDLVVTRAGPFLRDGEAVTPIDVGAPQP